MAVYGGGDIRETALFPDGVNPWDMEFKLQFVGHSIYSIDPHSIEGGGDARHIAHTVLTLIELIAMAIRVGRSDPESAPRAGCFSFDDIRPANWQAWQFSPRSLGGGWLSG